jgi:acetate kinase
MEGIVLLSNPGSASKKYSVYSSGVEVGWFHFEKDAGTYSCSFKVVTAFEKRPVSESEYHQSLDFVLSALHTAGITREVSDVYAVSIRTVIPDPDFVVDSLLTPQVAKYLKGLSVLDPLHINPVLDEIEVIKKSVAKRTFVCLISDSSFHTTSRRKMPVDLGRDIYGIGYHGLSCESVLARLEEAKIKHSKLVVCHLGGGSSVSAIAKSKSVYNTMEYSPLGGMFMASRPGSIDPFLVMQIMHEKKLSYEDGLKFLYTNSGLKALSGVSDDLREVRAEAFKGNQHAKQAIIQFVDSIAAHVCKAMSYTQGIDTLVFAGTIGFRAAYIREMVAERLSWLGIRLNHDRNLDDLDTCFEISDHNSSVRVVVVQIDEMREMHRHTVELLRIKI